MILTIIYLYLLNGIFAENIYDTDIKFLESFIKNKNLITLPIIAKENEKLTNICKNIKKKNLDKSISNIVYGKLTDIEKHWIIIFFDMVLNLEIKSRQIAYKLVTIFSNNILLLFLIDNNDLNFRNTLTYKLTSLFNIFDEFYVYNDSSWYSVMHTNFSRSNMLLFIKKLNETLNNFSLRSDFLNKHIICNNKENIDKLTILISSFVFSFFHKKNIKFLKQDVVFLKKYLFTLTLINVRQTIIINIVYKIINYNKNIYCAKEFNGLYIECRNTLSNKIIEKILKGQNFISSLCLKPIISYKIHRKITYNNIANVFILYIVLKDLRSELIDFLEIDSEELFIKNYINYLLSYENLLNTKLLIEAFNNILKNIFICDPSIFNILNYLVKYTVEQFYRLIQNFKYYRKRLKKVDGVMTSLINVLYIIITKLEDCETSAAPIDQIIRTYLFTSHGLFFLTPSGGYQYFFGNPIPLKIKKITAYNGLCSIDIKKTYLFLMAIKFIENDNIANINEKCKSYYLCIKLILRNELKINELFIPKEFDDINVLSTIYIENYDFIFSQNFVLECINNYLIDLFNNTRHKVSLWEYYNRFTTYKAYYLYNLRFASSISLYIDNRYDLINKGIRTLDEMIKKHKLMCFIPYNIYFSIEDASGAVGIGVMRNWIDNIASSILKDKKYLLMKSNIDNSKYITYSYTKNAFKTKEKEFEFIGRMLGLAYRLGILFPIEFADYIYEILLNGKSKNIKKHIESEFSYYFNIQNLKDFNRENFAFCAVDMSENDDELIFNDTIDLIEGYSRENIKSIEVLKNIILFRIGCYIMEPVVKMRNGMNTFIVPMETTDGSIDEFKKRIFGNSNVDVRAWKELTVIKDCKNNTDNAIKTVNIFWKFVESLSVDDRKKLLKFWTGSSNLPIIDVQANNNKLFTLVIGDGDNNSYPKAHTCINELYNIPYVDNEEYFKTKFDMIKSAADSEFTMI
ncbi:E3 ubiquitin-protein ligase SMURF2 [Astathelohania contejeani]|uniref:HECT-type E3 ubiquitin transferase n=1 Tax=Astathelohania contejeani TaxID=164912 RepID=A0ABQ7I2M5_9MICR|nr:E3 ubiquitin-protein ligase SMURF2 [Thelohania contejeani]